MSTRLRGRCQLALLALFMMVGVSAVLTLALAHGAANPPRAPLLRLRIIADEGLEPVAEDPTNRLRLLSLENYVDMPLTPPFTLEAVAENIGTSTAGWGLWLETVSPAGRIERWSFLLSSEGYYAIGSGETARWTAFPHLTNAHNRITLHVETDDRVTLRLNHEIAATIYLPDVTFADAGSAYYRSRRETWPRVLWTEISLYTSLVPDE